MVLDRYARRIIGFAVHVGDVDAPAIRRIFNDTSSCQGSPLRVSSHDNPLFQYHRWKATLRELNIGKIKSLPNGPISHTFVERLIDSVRRELLDLTLFWKESDLENKLRIFSTISISTAAIQALREPLH
jgi:transposase InsO family protein